jgi:hypothetical protein
MRHRIQFDCEEELYHDLNALIPRGVKRYVLECVVQALVKKLKEGNRVEILSQVMRKRFEFDDRLSVEMLEGFAKTRKE